MEDNTRYDITSTSSIVDFAKKLKNKTLREACGDEIEYHGYGGKGNFGQILEKFYFGYNPNSAAEPDFNKVGLELKTSSLKALKNGEYRSKERLVLNIINYQEVHKEKFENSTFWSNNNHLLLVFYLHEKKINVLDYIIKLVDEWKFPKEDLKIIKHDWELINNKIKSGNAHELSEGDTFYLGACTKGSTAAKSLRKQPFNIINAKQRAYSLKQGYVNHIIANISKGEKDVYGKIIKHPEILDEQTIEEVVISKFKKFYNKSTGEIEDKLGINLNRSSKSYFSQISKNLYKVMLGVNRNFNVEEFDKAEIIVRSVRIRESDTIKESVSFPAFKFKEVYNENWETSETKYMFERKFLFIFYKNVGDSYILKRAEFWNMPASDLKEVRKVWLKTKKVIQDGNIFSNYQRNKKGEIIYSVKGNPIRLNNFPSIKDNKVSHVRPHGKDSSDTYPLPVKDKVLKVEEYTKHSFWLKNSYILNEIYFKYDL